MSLEERISENSKERASAGGTTSELACSSGVSVGSMVGAQGRGERGRRGMLPGPDWRPQCRPPSVPLSKDIP